MSEPVLIAIVAFAVLFVAVTVIQNRNYRRRMYSLAAERPGESICQFARSLPYRQLDPAVIRHVYEAVQAEVAIPDVRLPIRASYQFSTQSGKTFEPEAFASRSSQPFPIKEKTARASCQ